MRQAQYRDKSKRRSPGIRKSPAQRKKAYNLIVNLAECWGDAGEAEKLAQKLQRRLRRLGWDCYLDIATNWDGFDKLVMTAIRKRPFAIIIFGGDGSVRLAAGRIQKAKRLLGIVPCGLYNNIFHSLYGHSDVELAFSIIKEGYQTRIDAAVANGTFFLGSLATGVVPGMIEKLGEKQPPRMTMTWGKLAGKAADETIPRTTTIKVDTYTIETQPLVLNVHLLSRLLSLRFAPVASPNDGRLVLIYDLNGTRDMITRYIKDLKKDKYQYNDAIRIVRGHHISITPIEGRTWYMDSEPVEFTGNELSIEIMHRALRVFSNPPKDK